MEGKQFHVRVRGVLCILAALFLTFSGVLYNLQVVHGADFQAQSTRRIADKETVEASRGRILDCYGRELVSNTQQVNVTIHFSAMGDEATRNATLLELLALSRAQNITWNDNLPITTTAPFVFTLDTASGGVRRNFTALLEIMSKKKWDVNGAARALAAEVQQRKQTLADNPDAVLPALATVSADALLEEMRTYYKVDPALPPEEARALVGLLYENTLRLNDIDRSGTYLFTQNVDIDFISMIKERGLKGVQTDEVEVRQYMTPYAAHLLGRVGLMDPTEWETYQNLGYNMDDTVGKDGVEKAFETDLRGEAGVRAVETNTNGKVVSETWLTEPQPGDNVILTIDYRLQEALERSLAEKVPNLSDQVQGASGVVIDVRDGGVLAMASYPTFDLSTLYTTNANYAAAANDPLHPLVNRATQGLYSPGSTFKMVMGVAGLEEGVITPREKIKDTGRFEYPKDEKYPYGTYHPQCWLYRQYGGKHGNINLSEALEVSCNVYFYTVGDRLQIDKIKQYANLFGLGEKTGIELPEYAGGVASPEYSQDLGQKWNGGDVLTASIGQGNTLSTPVQLANYIATLVNGGDRYRVHLLKSVKSNDFSQVIRAYDEPPIDSIDIDPANLEAVKLGMRMVAESGAGVSEHFKDLDVTVGAKTGSAQVSSKSATNAVFVCFAPYEDPQIAVALVAEKGGSGGGLAAVAADIIKAYFNGESTIESANTENTLLP